MQIALPTLMSLLTSGTPEAPIVVYIPGHLNDPVFRGRFVEQIRSALADPRTAPAATKAVASLSEVIGDPRYESSLLLTGANDSRVYRWPMPNDGPARIFIGSELPLWLETLVVHAETRQTLSAA